ncbi:hypothetical protein DFQ01_11071 [Paenibacillus cellulosilyticus]|uniref:Uncharacterized protein n=1 Tax=Paenibacillus cellulosilyticus TaxID=375489 RepID=A0A2V2YT24_9BACL|nr:hypothetical protein [Paenibacillus cellulosilyticus]PWW01181.1 hypothetical protein DFQ01_11071 [Paenibacillus cellulosilyticus]QKS46859.1 hypothetical protein HUB94_20465 [Paenibacillus cellulosilyticus]
MLIDYEAKLEMIQRAIENCSLNIEVLALTEDNRFVGIQGEGMRAYVVTPKCVQGYTWHSSAGSIMERELLQQLPDDYRLVEEVIGGQLEWQF